MPCLHGCHQWKSRPCINTNGTGQKGVQGQSYCHQNASPYDADSLDESPTSFIICSYQPLILELCINSMKVSVHVTLRITPNTEMSARSGFSPP